MNVPSHNFQNLLVGAIARHTVRVVNKEHTPFSFEFKLDQSSNSSEAEPSALKILPQRGTVGPESSTEIELIFEPKTEKVFNFNVVCDVKRKQDPVVLNVKGVGYKLHAQLPVEETRSVKLRLKNKGPPPGSSLLPINFDFIVQVKSGRGPVVLGPTMGMFPPWVTINPVRATAVCYEEVEVHMAYTPGETHFLDGTLVRLLIPTGHGEMSYTMELAGRARAPAVDFSFKSYDFGPCFVKRLGVEQADGPSGADDDQSTVLYIHNRDTTDVLISTDFEREPHLFVDLQAVMIPAGRKIEVPIVFTPRELMQYETNIPFKVNDFSTTNVKIKGRGVQLRLELLKPSMQTVDFGTLTGGANGILRSKQVSWEPDGPQLLRPKEQMPVTITF